MCSIQDALHPICSCGEDMENSSHYLLHCPDYSQERITVLNIVSCFVSNISDQYNDQLSEIVLYSKEDLDNIYDTSILDATINYLVETKRFDAEPFLCSPDVMALTLILLLKFICLPFFFVCFLFIIIIFYHFQLIFYILYVYFSDLGYITTYTCITRSLSYSPNAE